ncbi:MAG: DUF1592 domain-containing protein [Verrucomicrobiota bacterium]
MFPCWVARFGLIATAALVVFRASAADIKPDGAAIYDSLCIKCHGDKGQGVKEENTDPLEGDWSLEKLTRYIDRKMPDDDPKKCVGPDAEAVAQFIYDSFYSKEARLRNHPVRVELAHLTNRQYLNSMADLFRPFNGGSESRSTNSGLKAVYYNSKNFDKAKQITERIDPEIAFDFGEKGPEGTTTNEFAVHWRGSIFPEETGVYEFTVRTGNGMRLYVNDNEEPLIDAWVSTGTVQEHKASIRLLGGRSYPIRLDCFRFKEKTNVIDLRWKAPHGVDEVIPARVLSPTWSASVFVINTVFPADDSSIGYERGVAVSKEWDEAETHAALEAAAYATRNLDRFSKSKPTDPDRKTKVMAFCERFVSTALKAPLKAEEKEKYVTRWFNDETSLEESVKRVVLLSLKSPRFLYLNLPFDKPEFATAEHLSYTLWDSLPDDQLIKAAESGNLRDPKQVQAQAERMINDSRAHSKVRYFLEHWVQMNRVEEIARDKSVFPDFSPELAADLRTSLMLFLDDVAWNGSSDYRQLLLGKEMFVNERMAKFYNIPFSGTNGFEKVTLEEKGRAGILTHPFVLAAFSYPKFSSPIHRGVFITRNIVGRALRPPPNAVVFKDADFDPAMTMREKVTRLTIPESCQSCHSVINPLGFTLEHFDAVGRWREMENGKPINSKSTYILDDGEKVNFDNARDLAEFAANTETGRKAFIEQMFHQLVKQPIPAYGSQTLEQLESAFARSNFSIQKLAIEIAKLTALHQES